MSSKGEAEVVLLRLLREREQVKTQLRLLEDELVRLNYRIGEAAFDVSGIHEGLLPRIRAIGRRVK